MTPEKYIEKRFDDQRKYYDRKAQKYKKMWHFWGILIIILLPLPMFLLTFAEMQLWVKILISLSSYLVSVASSLLNFLKYRELFINYRAVEQEMKREYQHYITRTKYYEKLDDDKAFKLFVERIEALLAQENSKWLDDNLKQQDLPQQKL